MKIKSTFLLFLFIARSALADLSCDISVTDYNAVYEANSYTCVAGTYLPANALGCASCSSSFSCSGGTFNFDPNIFQGLSVTRFPNNTTNSICAVNFPGDLTAVYEANQHTCAPGYYLPANVDECRPCLNDSYCPGGTHIFNETTPQGIVSCPSAHPFAPVGMWQESQCGRKLHVGNDVLYMHQSPAYPTGHRLFVRYQNSIYSANTIIRNVNSESFPKMSIGMAQELHIAIGDVEYLVCDDSVPECRNSP